MKAQPDRQLMISNRQDTDQRQRNIASKLGKLLIIDAQNTFMDPKGPFGADGLRIIQGAWNDGISPLLGRARTAGAIVGWTQAVYAKGQFHPKDIDKDTFHPFDLLGVQGNSAQGILIVNPHTGEADADWQIRIWERANEDHPKERVFYKDSNVPFRFRGQDNGLETWLGDAQIVLVVGFTTTSCVKAAVEAIVKPGRLVGVLEDCVGVREKRRSDQATLLATWSSDDCTDIIVASQRQIEFVDATREI